LLRPDGLSTDLAVLHDEVFGEAGVVGLGNETGSQRVWAVSVGADLERLSNGTANDR
jgi:hypothetical protein